MCLWIRHYTIRYRERNRKWIYQTCPTSDTVIDNLKPNTNYEFGVRSNKDDRSGMWSKPVIHNTNMGGNRCLKTLIQIYFGLGTEIWSSVTFIATIFQTKTCRWTTSPAVPLPRLWYVMLFHVNLASTLCFEFFKAISSWIACLRLFRIVYLVSHHV